ncbi:DUF2777 domain-containing protein [Bacillus sp. B-jedd]|uniref:DUF2777 domain-containing protein n=1 Tax=Bacillus sp. B-jedd TaxID=1476857 RepID=UPI0005156B1C|nr:DUF2777 domain-containing protein [Bacillus sp. B-jedd]CEG26058.1 glycolate oxidase, iron-sulfur subunit [Bacillus sp. B-jedd]
MNRQQREKLYQIQERAYTEGSVENMNDQWVFFEEETEEASLMDEYLLQEVEIFRLNRWKRGTLIEPGKISSGEEIIVMRDSDRIRVRKHLIYSLERLLERLHGDAFIQFVTTLNSLRFSIYDCLYCYNHLNFLNGDYPKNGVNFMIFDNQEEICGVQHHFCYFEKESDRFEFTLNTGKRLVIEKLASP